MAKEYHRIQINSSLLDDIESITPDKLTAAKQGVAYDNIPFEGKLIGVYFISYVDCKCKGPKSGLNHTEIRIEDTRGRLLTGVTDIRDYLAENWAKESYKELSFPFKQNERINIGYTTKAGEPIVGEFVFVIETEDYTESTCDI